MIESTTKLNTPGTKLGSLAGVHALTDVTGFGLLGHLLEICKGSSVAAHLDWDKLPLLPGALDLARQGFTTGASKRNFAGYGDKVSLSPSIDEAGKALLTDPQTSGGLLVSCAPDSGPGSPAPFRAGGLRPRRGDRRDFRRPAGRPRRLISRLTLTPDPSPKGEGSRSPFSLGRRAGDEGAPQAAWNTE